MNTICSCHIHVTRGRRSCDHMVVGITSTYAISAHHHWCCEFESRSGKGVQQYVIKFVSDLWQVGGFLWFPPVSLTNKTDRHDITVILLKVTLNTIKQTYNKTCNCETCLNLSKPNLLGTNFCVQNRHVFGLYRINLQNFSTFGLYQKFGLHRISNGDGFDLDHFN